MPEQVLNIEQWISAYRTMVRGLYQCSVQWSSRVVRSIERVLSLQTVNNRISLYLPYLPYLHVFMTKNRAVVSCIWDVFKVIHCNFIHCIHCNFSFETKCVYEYRVEFDSFIWLNVRTKIFEFHKDFSKKDANYQLQKFTSPLRIGSDGSRIFQRGFNPVRGCATVLFAKCLLETAWKWKNLVQEWGAYH